MLRINTFPNVYLRKPPVIDHSAKVKRDEDKTAIKDEL